MTVKFKLRFYLLDPRFVVRFAVLSKKPRYLTQQVLARIKQQQEEQKEKGEKKTSLGNKDDVRQPEEEEDRETKLATVRLAPGTDWIFTIEDVMTRLYRIHSPKRPLTGKEIYLRFIMPVIQAFAEQPDRLWEYIIVFDKPEYMKKPKLRHLPAAAAADEEDDDTTKGQEENNKNKVIYPADANFTDAGIEWVDAQGATRKEFIQAGAVMDNRELRPRFYEFLMGKMKADEHLKPYRILVDVFVDGPLAFAGGSWRQATELKNDIGEADLSVWYWAKLCRSNQHHLRIVCSDRDLILIGMLHYMAEFHQQVASLLIDVQSKLTEVLNLTHLVPAMIAAGYSVEALVIGVMLCTTDFVDKKTTFDKCNDEFIVDYTHRWMDSNKEHHVALVKHHSVDAFVQFIRDAYEAMPEETRKRVKIPSVKKMHEQAGMVFDGLVYWQSLGRIVSIKVLQKQTGDGEHKRKQKLKRSEADDDDDDEFTSATNKDDDDDKNHAGESSTKKKKKKKTQTMALFGTPSMSMVPLIDVRTTQKQLSTPAATEAVRKESKAAQMQC